MTQQDILNMELKEKGKDELIDFVKLLSKDNLILSNKNNKLNKQVDDLCKMLRELIKEFNNLISKCYIVTILYIISIIVLIVHI